MSDHIAVRMSQHVLVLSESGREIEFSENLIWAKLQIESLHSFLDNTDELLRLVCRFLELTEKIGLFYISFSSFII